MLAGRVTQPILRLAQLWQNFQQARISMDKLSDKQCICEVKKQNFFYVVCWILQHMQKKYLVNRQIWN